MSLADLWVRILAFLLDAIFVIIVFMIMSSILVNAPNIAQVLFVISATCYHLLFEIFNKGQSPGKMITRIRVVSLDGSVPSLKSLIVRWAFRIIDILATFGSLASFSILSSSFSQRIGDIVAGTVVVRTAHTAVPTLDALKTLNTNTEPIVYPQMKIYDDNDMVLLKKGLDRYKQRPTLENRKVLYKIYDGIIVDTDIEPAKGSKIDFLNDAITSYILSTR